MYSTNFFKPHTFCIGTQASLPAPLIITLPINNNKKNNKPKLKAKPQNHVARNAWNSSRFSSMYFSTVLRTRWLGMVTSASGSPVSGDTSFSPPVWFWNSG